MLSVTGEQLLGKKFEPAAQAQNEIMSAVLPLSGSQADARRFPAS